MYINIFKIFLALITTATTLAYTPSAYSLDIANTAVWLSGASYCNKENYKTMVLSGPATGFIVESILYDPKSDLQGFVGVLPSTKSIYITFRGSSSVRNWLDDFKVLKTPYVTYPECNCAVHKGFYGATTSLKSQVIDIVKILNKKYRYDNIIVTSHSLGAAVGQLIAMELKATTSINSTLLSSLSIYNFGQPRIGDAKYAAFVNTIIGENKLWRFTHNTDIVPHVPPLKMGYEHSCREVFEENDGLLRMCSASSGEDPTCADQYSLVHTTFSDHEIYLGHFLDCKNSTKKIVHKIA